MLKIFKTNQIFNSILLIFYILLLRASVFVISPSIDLAPEGIWSNTIFSWFGNTEIVAQCIAILLLLIQAFLINILISEHRLDQEVNMLPGLFYILISCAIPEFLYLSPLLLANTFLLLAIYTIFQTYKMHSAADRIFNTGFLLGIASLFYFSYAIFILWVFISLNVLRAFKIKEKLMTIVGFIVPYFLAATYYFWFDRLGEFWQFHVLDNFAFLDFNSNQGGMLSNIILVVFSLIVLFVIVNIGAYKMKKVIEIQKKVSILFWLLFFSAFSIFLQANVGLTHLQILAVPLSIFLAFSFSSMKSQWAEALHLVLLVSILALQFQPILI